MSRRQGGLAASLCLALATLAGGAAPRQERCGPFICDQGGIIRGVTAAKRLALVFTGGTFADGGDHIRGVLRRRGIKAAFFFTGDFYREPAFQGLIRGLAEDGHYLGPHSDKHLLYCDWSDRTKTLVTRDEFVKDILANYKEMERFGVARKAARFFIPPYEWYNEEVARWSRETGLVLFNFSPGTSSNADYTTPEMKEYLSSQAIYDRILAYEKKDPQGLNGFILLIHVGTDPARTDKFYLKLGPLIDELARRGYTFSRLDSLLASDPVE